MKAKSIIDLVREVAPLLSKWWVVTPIHDLTDRGYLEIQHESLQLFFIIKHQTKEQLIIEASYPIQGWQHFVKDEDKVKPISISLKKSAKVIAADIEKRILPSYVVLHKELKAVFDKIQSDASVSNTILESIGELTHGAFITDTDYYGTYLHSKVYFGGKNSVGPEGEIFRYTCFEGEPKLGLKLTDLTPKETEKVLEYLIKIKGNKG